MSQSSSSNTVAQKEWRAIIATGVPAAAPNDIILQTLTRRGTGATIVWFNMTQSYVFTTAPSVASLAENLPNISRPKTRWTCATTTYNSTNGALSTEKFLFIRNLGSSNVRIQSLDLAIYVGQAGVSGQRLWFSLRGLIHTGVSAITGGTNQTTMKCVNGVYSSDSATLTMTQGSITGYTATTSNVISSFYHYGTQDTIITSIPATTSVSPTLEWAKGLVIPAGGGLTIEGATLATPTSTPYISVSTVLTEE